MQEVYIKNLVKMVTVQDLRGNGIRQEAIAHTEVLEEIVKSQQHHKTWTKVKGAVGQVYDLLETAGVGYLAGYVVSGGDMDTATQFAEYATVLWAGFKVGVELPLKRLMRKTHRNIEEKVNEEARKAEQLEARGQLHKYKPEQGMDFSNHGSNYDNLIENNVQSKYWGNLEGARKPIRRTARNVMYGAFGMWLASLMVDTEVNIIDLVGPNPIEKGLELTHYLIGQIEPIKDYVSLTAHEHIGDFNQMQMVYIGAAGGILQTAREFIKGNYQRLRTKLKRST